MSLELTDQQKVYAFRRFLGIYFLYYWLQFFANLDLYFFLHLPNRGLFQYSFFWDIRIFVYALLIFLNFALLMGQINRWMLALLIFLTWNFNYQNPLIISETQPMSFFMLISFMFLPLNEKYPFEKFYLKAILFFVGFYYFLAGVMKLGDPLPWKSGYAIQHILQWNMAAKSIALNNWITANLPSAFFQIVNYWVLAFEISFIFLLFSRFRKILIPMGLLFHLLIFIFLDVGSISQLMLVWYILI
jgi:hypothetical protein